MPREIKQLPPLGDEDKMPFGKHKGEKLVNIPGKYLLYIYESGISDSNERVKAYIKENLEVIKQQAKEGQ